jgi:CRP/FNR family cyclic AMP-dependent transcriptional regulator
MTMVSNLELIRRVPLFSMLTANQAESVADAIVKRRFKRGYCGTG